MKVVLHLQVNFAGGVGGPVYTRPQGQYATE